MKTIHCFTHEDSANVVIEPIDTSHYSSWLAVQPASVQAQLHTVDFQIKDHQHVCFYNAAGQLFKVLIGIEKANLYSLASLPLRLPLGNYALQDPYHLLDLEQVAIGWGLGAYQFTEYKPAKRAPACLTISAEMLKMIAPVLEAIYFVRNLITQSAEQLGPAELAKAAHTLAAHHQAACSEIIGDELLAQNFPAIHAVGRASARAPRLIELRWGDPQHRKLTLVGKGVCFDTGGYDLKSASNMLGMNKDMGGAAHVLGLAHMIMSAKLPVNLQVLIPAVENSIAGNAYRPGDVIKSRKGLTIEIGNTDAEGRLILCDALTYAQEGEMPDLLIDMATLTGAARIAVGTEIAAFFTNHDLLANELLGESTSLHDPLWRMPLYEPYSSLIESNIADINNASKEPYAGAITAALFLKTFVKPDCAWMHFDMMAANISDKPGRPRGGEAQGLRALFNFLFKRYNHH